MASLDQILDNTGGALAIGTFLVLRPFLHERYRRWGATDPEVYCTLPGDERVPHSLVTQTMAITINASPAQIWPWIAQIGQERGGLYSYDLLENIARCQMHNADHIVPEWELKPGDRVRLGPAGYPVHGVVGVERASTGFCLLEPISKPPRWSRCPRQARRSSPTFHGCYSWQRSRMGRRV